MRLLIRQRIFSWTDSYDIYDESGNQKYHVKAEAFTLGHQIHVYDAGGGEVGRIEQRPFSFLPTFTIYVGGRFLGRVKKRFALFFPSYEIEGLGWIAEGNFAGWDYSVMAGDRTVMQLSKELFQWSDTYQLTIADPCDELAALLIAISIDAANCGQ